MTKLQELAGKLRKLSLVQAALAAFLASFLLSIATDWQSPWWWAFFAASGILGILFVSRSTWRPGPKVGDGIAVSLFFLVTAVMFPEFLMGDRPVDHDHTVHYFRIWQLKEEFLKDGRLWGWSDRWYLGYPAQYLYPFGADFFVLAVWALTLGLLGLEGAYGLAFCVFWALQGVALYWLGRNTLGRAAGLIGGLLFLTSQGAFRFGGWVFAAEWGVWPNSLSIVFSLFAVSQLPALFDSNKWRPVGFFGIWMGLALLTHPLQIVNLGLIFAVSALLQIKRRGGSRAIVRLATGSALSAGIGALWFVPFLSAKAYTKNYGIPWKSSADMGEHIYLGVPIEGVWPVAGILGLVGIVGLLWTRKVGGVFIALMFIVLLSAGSSTTIEAFRLLEISTSFSYLQYPRFGMLAVPFLLLAAGWTTTKLIEFLPKNPDTQTILNLALALFLVAPISVGAADSYFEAHLGKSLTPSKERPNRVEIDRMAEWIEGNWDGEKFFRVAIDVGTHDHSLVDLGTRISAPIYKVGFTPAETFIYKIEVGNSEVFHVGNVRYVVRIEPISTDALVLANQFGPYLIYEIKHWRPERYSIAGSGSIEVREWSDEYISLIAHQGSEGILRLHISNFKNWRAYHNGQLIEIERLPLSSRPGGSNLIGVSLSGGEYEFIFQRSWIEKMGLISALLTLTLSILLIFRSRSSFDS